MGEENRSAASAMEQIRGFVLGTHEMRRRDDVPGTERAGRERDEIVRIRTRSGRMAVRRSRRAREHGVERNERDDGWREEGFGAEKHRGRGQRRQKRFRFREERVGKTGAGESRERFTRDEDDVESTLSEGKRAPFTSFEKALLRRRTGEVDLVVFRKVSDGESDRDIRVGV